MLFTFGCCRFRETVENVRKTTTTLKKKPTPNQTKKYSLYKKTKQKKQLNDFKFSYFEYSA